MASVLKLREVLLAVVGFLLSGVNCRGVLFADSYEDNYAQSNSISPIGSGGAERVNWVKIEQKTGRVVRVNQGQRVELVCEATGSPAPSVQWFKGYVPISRLQESNDISESGLGSIVSKYVIECAQPIHQGVYTCKGVSGEESAASLPTALIVEGNLPALFTSCENEIKPKIVASRPVVLETNNNNVVLPCTVHGKPKPKVFWIDEDNNIIDHSRDSRFKVLPSGDLSILRIRWSDMGRYVCVAENKAGKDTATTFLYPLKNEN